MKKTNAKKGVWHGLISIRPDAPGRRTCRSCGGKVAKDDRRVEIDLVHISPNSGMNHVTICAGCVIAVGKVLELGATKMDFIVEGA